MYDNEVITNEIREIFNYHNINGINEEAKEFIRELIKDLSERKIATWPYPNCNSFEYANVNGIKGAQTLGITNLFVAYYPINQSRSGVSVITITYPSLFFKMPLHWTNGRAATLTAEAVNNSINLTKDWFVLNPRASEHELQLFWMASLKAQMAIFGGTVGTVNLFSIRSPAPYTTSWFKSNCG